MPLVAICLHTYRLYRRDWVDLGPGLRLDLGPDHNVIHSWRYESPLDESGYLSLGAFRASIWGALLGLTNLGPSIIDQSNVRILTD